jgi:hypothetical protein
MPRLLAGPSTPLSPIYTLASSREPTRLQPMADEQAAPAASYAGDDRGASARPRLLLRRRRRRTSGRRVRCSWGTCCCGRGSLTSHNSSASSSCWRRWSWCGATTIPRATSVGRRCRHAGERRRSAARGCGGAAVLDDSP